MKRIEPLNDLVIFYFVAQDDPDTIGPDGIEKLCRDLAVDPENVRVFLMHF